MTDKLVIDQIAHPHLPHAYQYRDTLIVLEGGVLGDDEASIVRLHVTTARGLYDSAEVDAETPEEALRNAVDLVDTILDHESDRLPDESFAALHLEMQHNYLHGDLALVD